MEQPKSPVESEKTVPSPTEPAPVEIGGAKRSTDPTRYQDWEINGKCVDF